MRLSGTIFKSLKGDILLTMEKNFENKKIAKYYELHGIEFDQRWPFPEDFFEKLRYFIGIDWSGNGNDVQNKKGKIERPVFYVARGSTHPHMACIKPSKADGTRNPKYRDLDNIANVQDITQNKQFWYCAVDHLKFANTIFNDDYLIKIASKLAICFSEERRLRISEIGILLDGDFNPASKNLVFEILKRKDNNFSYDNITSEKDADRNVRIVSSADNVAYFLRENYINTGKILRPDRRIIMGRGDLKDCIQE